MSSRLNLIFLLLSLIVLILNNNINAQVIEFSEATNFERDCPANPLIPADIRITSLSPLTGQLFLFGIGFDSAQRLAVDLINANDTILPHTTLHYSIFDTETNQAGGLRALLSSIDEDANSEIPTLSLTGAASSAISTIIAIAGGVFEIPQIGIASTAESLANPVDFPFFNRVVPGDDKQGQALAAICFQFELYRVGAISTADEYGVGGINNFISAGAALTPLVEVETYQQFVMEATDIEVEMNELQRAVDETNTRVFVCFMLPFDFQTVLVNAIDRDMVGENFIWLCPDGCADPTIYTDRDTGEILENLRIGATGMLGTAPQQGVGEPFERFLDEWEQLDPVEFPQAGDRNTLFPFVASSFDAMYASAITWHNLFCRQPENFTSQAFNEEYLNLNFLGITGNITVDEFGDRLPIYDILNVRADRLDDEDTNEWTRIGTVFSTAIVNNTATFEVIFDIEPTWYDGSPEFPNLNLQPTFEYWSCHDEESKKDDTGLTIKTEFLESGDDLKYSKDPDNIDSTYECDQFIDCNNMSDEGYHCSPSYKIVFIIIGILTSLSLGIIIFYVIFTIIFGLILKRQRIKVLSPPFLLIMCFAAFIGTCSTFAWYGKPHTVACNFQIWLLAPSVCLLVSALFVKVTRIWLIFRNPLKTTTVRDWQLLIFLAILMFPCFFLCFLWTLISTPQAKIQDVDGVDHYICTTGGFTGKPGGLVFFIIMVTYIFIILCFGVFSYTMLRCIKVPSKYNEADLVGYAVYNLTFLSAVVIPVFFVLRFDSPVAAWIIRTFAILYGFHATLFLQFVPHILIIIFKNRCKEEKYKPKEMSDFSQTGTGTSTQG